MFEYLKLAWRNIWRNKRRTLITIASVFFAMFFALVMRSLQVGTYDYMIKSVLENYIGYIQIHKIGYTEDPVIDSSFNFSEEIIQKISNDKNVKAVIPRLESFALASFKENSKGVMILGIDPEKEKLLTKPDKKIIEGRYLQNQNEVIIADKLAEYFGVRPRDTIAFISQGYHGASSSGLFVVAGIIGIPNPELSKTLIYMPLHACQNFFQAENQLTSLVININDNKLLNQTLESIKKKIDPEQFEVLSYEESSPELIQQIKSDEGSGFIMLGVLYMIVGFGVFGTIMMMMAERRREFGVMMAVGMQKLRLTLLVVTEMILMALTGIAAGVIGGLPVVYYLSKHPIRFTGEMAKTYENLGWDPVMPAIVDARVFIFQSIVVLLIFFIAIIYPVYSLNKLKEINALKA
jgi:ABC-type lipoprotein release transport system permease subunit